MATISAIHSILTLNTNDFRSGLQKATKRAKKFGKEVGRHTLTIAKWGGAMAAAALAAGTAWVKHHLDAIAATARLADRMDISVESLTRMQHAARATGANVEVFTEGLTEMVQRLGEAQTGTGSAADQLKLLGLSAAQLANMAPEEAFGRIADEINKLPTQADRIFAIDEIFGGDGREFVNLIDRGSEGIARLGDAGEKAGSVLSSVDANQVLEATKSLGELGVRIQNIGRQLTVELAPFIEAAAERLIAMGGDGATMADRVTGAVEWVAGAAAKLADWWNVVKYAFYGMRAVIVGGLGLIVKGIALAGKAIEKLVNLLPGVEVSFTKTLDAIGDEWIKMGMEAREQAADAADAFFEGRNSQKVAAAFAEIRREAGKNAEAMAAAAQRAGQAQAAVDEKAVERLKQQAENRKKVTETLADYQKQLDRIGMSDTEIKIADLKELGATNDQLEKARRTLEQINAIEAKREREADISKTLEDLEQQVRRFGLSEQEKTILDLEALGASTDQLERARAAMAELERLRKGQDQPGQDRGRASMILAGSAEAQRLAFAAARGNRSEDVPKKQLDTQKQMAETLATIEKNTRARAGGGAGAEEWEL